jgi:cell division transport system permease protein
MARRTTMTDDARALPPAGGTGALLPPDGGRDRPLFLVAAILVFLACIAALGARGAWLAADGWTSDLESSLTIQIRPVEDRDTDADASAAAQLALEISGISNAVARDRSYAEALLEPWLGTENLPDDLPLPLMVEIELDANSVAPTAALQAALDEAGLPASVDDHSRWLDAVRRSARAAQTLALSLLALLAGAAAAVVAFAARASLAARIDVTDALHLCGAEDQYIAALFQRRFFMLGLNAGTAGAAVAAVVSFFVSLGRSPVDASFFLPNWSMDPFELTILIAAPILAGLTSAISAHMAVVTDLRGRW